MGGVTVNIMYSNDSYLATHTKSVPLKTLHHYKGNRLPDEYVPINEWLKTALTTGFDADDRSHRRELEVRLYL